MLAKAKEMPTELTLFNQGSLLFQNYILNTYL